MKIDRNKVYGYSKEYLLEHGEPRENRQNIRADFEDALTREELAKYFPNQWLVVEQVDHNGYPEEGRFNTAKVRYYRCNPFDTILLVKKLREEEPNKRVLFMDNTTWDITLEDIPYNV